MNNSRSLEALYQDGTGMVSLPKKSFKASIEGYDGFDDMLSIEMARSEEDLQFIDAFQMVEAKTAHDKILMCKKLAANYGSKSGVPGYAGASIESLCRIQSLEEADNAEAAGVDTKTESSQKPEVAEKKGNFFKTVFKAIGNFFKKIWDFFKRLVSKIIGLFSKKEEAPAPETKTEETHDVDMNVQNTPETDATKKSNSSASSNETPDASYINADIYYLDPTTLNDAGLRNFCKMYKSLASGLGSNISIIKNYGNNSDANAAANELVSSNKLKPTINTASGICNLLMPAFDFKGKSLDSFANAKLSNPGMLKELKSYIEEASRKLVWAKPVKDKNGNDVESRNAYKLIEILFGLKYDKKLGDTLRNKNAKNILQNYTTGVKESKVKFANVIKPAMNDLDTPHKVLVQICDDLAAKFDAYASKVESGKGDKAVNINAYWDYVGTMTALLKLCTKLEQAVVKCTDAVFEYYVRFDKLLKDTKNGTKRRQ